MSKQPVSVLDIEDVGALLDISPATVRSNLRDSRQATETRTGKPGRYADRPFPKPDGRVGGNLWWATGREAELKDWHRKLKETLPVYRSRSAGRLRTDVLSARVAAGGGLGVYLPPADVAILTDALARIVSDYPAEHQHAQDAGDLAYRITEAVAAQQAA